MESRALLAEIKERLERAHGARLCGVILYGSEARGEARADSDVDVLVLLADPVDYGRDLQMNIDAVYDLGVLLGRRISAKPVSAQDYERGDCPLFRRAREEGIAA
jgi:uncharacterized protein